MSQHTVTVRLNLVRNPTTKLVAMCDVEANGVAIRGVKVVLGSNGPFAGMPSRPKRNEPNEYEDIAFPTSKSLSDEIQKVVVAEYQRQLTEA
jgi:stage V sporulation protein G